MFYVRLRTLASTFEPRPSNRTRTRQIERRRSFDEEAASRTPAPTLNLAIRQQLAPFAFDFVCYFLRK